MELLRRHANWALLESQTEGNRDRFPNRELAEWQGTRLVEGLRLPAGIVMGIQPLTEDPGRRARCRDAGQERVDASKGNHYSAARNLVCTLARAASFAGKALALARHAASSWPSPRSLPRGAARRPSSDSPSDCAVLGELSSIAGRIETAPSPSQALSPE